MDISRINGYKNFINFNEKELIETNTNKNDTFSNLLSNAINQVNEMQLEGEEYKKLLTIGELDNLHDLTIATEKANTALQVVMSVRNKVVEAYREIMRIQI